MIVRATVTRTHQNVKLKAVIITIIAFIGGHLNSAAVEISLNGQQYTQDNVTFTLFDKPSVSRVRPASTSLVGGTVVSIIAIAVRRVVARVRTEDGERKVKARAAVAAVRAERANASREERVTAHTCVQRAVWEGCAKCAKIGGKLCSSLLAAWSLRNTVVVAFITTVECNGCTILET